MYKYFKNLIICGIIASVLWCISLLSDKQELRQGLIRFHVVANSNNADDQAIKIKVRDAVFQSIQKDLTTISDISAAKDYLLENIPKIQKVVNNTLSKSGYPEWSSVSLCKEYFDVRHYDTFSLPAGIYDSLRIIIGEGNGNNWWCVAFPSLCIPATAAEFENAAVGAGFSKAMSKTLSGQYTIRFYLLDRLGQLENIFYIE